MDEPRREPDLHAIVRQIIDILQPLQESARRRVLRAAAILLNVELEL